MPTTLSRDAPAVGSIIPRTCGLRFAFGKAKQADDDASSEDMDDGDDGWSNEEVRERL